MQNAHNNKNIEKSKKWLKALENGKRTATHMEYYAVNTHDAFEAS